MILKKTEKDSIIKGIYESSTILGSVYDKQKKELTIIFKYGGQYLYEDVSLSDFTRFETADSNGSVFDSVIKKKYTKFKKLETLTKEKLALILEQAGNLKPIIEDKNETSVTNGDRYDIEQYKKIAMLFISGLTDFITTNKIKNSVLDEIEKMLK